MCGIAGIVGQLTPELDAQLASMADGLRHRGPDCTALLKSEENLAHFAMNTLAIISPDESYGPYRDPESGVMITFNGEIYNFRGLAERWGISIGRHETDAHLVLRAYQKFGDACIDEFDGMFALAIYDPRDRTVILARDGFGEKPLYYAMSGEYLTFASELKAVQRFSEFPASIRPEWLSIENLLDQDTPYPDISLLTPGTMVKFKVAGGSTEPITRTYWNLAKTKSEVPDTYADALDRFEELILAAAKSRIPDTKTAMMLSGGLDSAVLAYLIKPDYLVTVRYPNEDQLDELDRATLVAEDLGMDLIVVEPTPADFVTRSGRIIESIDYPLGNASLLSEYMGCERIAETGARVVFGGTGPDELLLGYVRHSLLLDGPDGVGEIERLTSYARMTQSFQVSMDRGHSAAERYSTLLLRGPDLDLRVRRTIYESFRSAGSIDRGLSIADLSVTFPSLLLSSDKISSAFGLERRSPYLARELAEYCYALPLEYKRLGSGVTKRILRDLAERIGVPRAIWADPGKQGFASPVPKWLNGELHGWWSDQISEAVDDDLLPPLARIAIQRSLAGSDSDFDRDGCKRCSSPCGGSGSAGQQLSSSRDPESQQVSMKRGTDPLPPVGNLNISVIGTGYLGVTHAACMAELGFDVLALDVDKEKVANLAAGRLTIYEQGLESLLSRNLGNGRLRFTTDYEEVASFGDVHFVCVGTPQRTAGRGTDLSQVESVIRSLAPHLERECLVVGKSTVPVGTAERLAALLSELAPVGAEAKLAWNPEFLRESFAVQDTLHPDRIVVGATSSQAVEILRRVYGSMIERRTPFIVTDFRTAELVKVAANSFLATKISFINAMAEVCEAVDADVTTLAEALSHDERIGGRFLVPGIGYGGGCLPKDVRGFIDRVEELGLSRVQSFLEGVDRINLARRDRIVELVREQLDGGFAGRTVAVLGAAFKPNSDDVRDSPALAVAEFIRKAGGQVKVYDPEATHNATRTHPQLSHQKSLLETVTGADAVLLLTEWDEFRKMEPDGLAFAVRRKNIVDGRSVLDPSSWRTAGWDFRAPGRPGH
ncbi:asparagine synthase (glutamine-hydrolyzing) [Streptacidiphilus sp. 4-A2]|nr:asparagine synthase (glutamine-hydrolyzing) [Streptacidiphilus sp. 4-A2]